MTPSNTESRLHERRVISRANGCTLASVVCPFCGVETEAYVWSLAGSGKRCECCAVHHQPAVTTKQVLR
jgi:hypothetical protein